MTAHSLNGAAYPPFYKVPQEAEPDDPRLISEPLEAHEIEFPFEDVGGGGDENKIRGNWSSKVEFVLSCLGFAVGLGNVWRFPYYCYLNGGGAFLIPYFIMLFLAGIPMFFMELSLGQFASVSCVSVWKVCPLFKGVGIAMFIVSCFIGIYYNMIMGWAIFYLASSFRAELPWASCENTFNTDNCVSFSREALENCTTYNGTMLRNGTCISAEELGFYDLTNLTKFIPNITLRTLPSDEYFHLHVLEASSGIEEIGTIRWQLALCLLLSWLIVFVCLFKSIKSSGKVAYFTTLAPYVILLILLVRALTLKGSFDGVVHFFSFRYEKLLDPRVWGDAAVQVFFSLSSCWGGLVTLASYNRFHNNCFKDMWIIAIGDALTSIFAGTVIFAALGFMAYELDVPVGSVAKSGPGLAFVVYAQALAKLPLAPLWSVLFFAMLCMLAVDTQFFIVETVVTSICDEFPERLRKNHRHVLALCCFIFYACGVPLCTQAGIYMLTLLDYFSGSWSLLIIGFFECMAIAWVYGIDNFLDNIKWMIGYYPPPYIFWKIMWKFITPLFIMGIMLFTWIYYEPLEYQGVPFPMWANFVGWGISFLSVSAIPVTMVYTLCTANGHCVTRVRDLICPADDWGPALAVHRAEQFPLQVPEAREPQKIYPNNIEVVGLLNGLHDTSDNIVLPDVPKFDKETAI